MQFGFIFIVLNININCESLSGKHWTCEYDDTRDDFYSILPLTEFIGFKDKIKYFQDKKKKKHQMKHLNECMLLERILKYLCC